MPGAAVPNQLTPQLSSDSSQGQATSLGLRPPHDPLLASCAPSGSAKPLEENKEG